MNEAGLNAKWLGVDMTHKQTQEFSKDVLNHMRERLKDYQEQYGDLYNLAGNAWQSLPATVWQSTTRSVSQTLRLQMETAGLLTIRTVPLLVAYTLMF